MPLQIGNISSDKIRVVMFTDSLEPSSAGRVIAIIARYLPHDRYEQFLVCPEHRNYDPFVNDTSPYMKDNFRCTLRGDTDITALNSLVEKLRIWDVHIFHNHIGATWEGDWGTLAARCAAVPFVVATEHLPNILNDPYELEHRRSVNRMLDHVFTVSESVAVSMVNSKLIRSDAISVVENGVEDMPDKPSRDYARSVLRIPNDIPLVLYSGRLSDQKDPFLLVKAMRRLIDQGINAKCLIAGDGWLKGDIERCIHQLNLHEYVELLDAYTDTAILMTAADVLADTSRYEGLPFAILEAMSFGIPIVGCDVPGVNDAVIHGVTGWLSPIANVDDFAYGLELAINSPAGKAWGRASRLRYERRFTAELMGQRQDQAYQSIITQFAHQTAFDSYEHDDAERELGIAGS